MVFQVLFLMEIRTWEEYFFLYARGQRKEASKSPERVPERGRQAWKESQNQREP